MNDQELQQAFILFLAQKSGAKTQLELEQYIQSLGEEGIKQAQQEFMQIMQLKTRKAAHGSKLQYFKKLKNKCSEGEELVYYKRGGAIDCGCVKKAESGTQISKGEEGIVSKFKRKAKELIRGKKEEPKKKRETWGDVTLYYAKGDGKEEDAPSDNALADHPKRLDWEAALKKKKEQALLKTKKNQKGSKIKVSCHADGGSLNRIPFTRREQ